jgi:hypothetical protein
MNLIYQGFHCRCIAGAVEIPFSPLRREENNWNIL